MAPKYKLTYFELTGLAEPIRFLLSYGGIDYDDIRISQDDWPALKPTMPLGMLPILEVDGKTLHRSTAICRYVAKKVGLAGDDDLEAYEIDAAYETITDLRLSIIQYMATQDPNEKQKILENLERERLPFLLSKLDAWAEKNNGYFANGKLSWADLYFVSNIDYLIGRYGRDFVADYSNLVKVRQNVKSIPAIKTWIEQRPADNYKD